MAGAIAAGGLLLGGVLVFLAQIIKNRFQWADDWLDNSQYQHQNVTLILLFAIVFLVFISTNISTNLYPYYLLKLISTNEMALLMSSFSISFFLGFSSIGILSDIVNWLSIKFIKKNIGRIGVLVLGLLISSIGYVLPLINNVQPNTALSLFMIRATVIGIGFGVSLPPLIALIAEQASHYRWGLTISWYFAVCAIGAFTAPYITSYLIENSGYSPQLSTQPASVHVTITSTIPWLLLISIFIALIIGIIVLVINVKPLQDISSIETN